MTSLRTALCLAVVMFLSVACVGSEVSRLSDVEDPPKGKDCPIKMFPSTTPDYEWEDIASVKAKCHSTTGRSAWVQELREKACALGAHRRPPSHRRSRKRHFLLELNIRSV